MKTELMASNNNVIPFEVNARLKAIGVEIHAKVKDAQDHIDMARIELLDVGELLLEARSIHKDNHEFGEWCADLGGACTNKDNRACLMTLAANRDEVISRCAYLDSEAKQPRSLLACLMVQQADLKLPPFISTDDYLRELSAASSHNCEDVQSFFDDTEKEAAAPATSTVKKTKATRPGKKETMEDTLRNHYLNLQGTSHLIKLLGRTLLPVLVAAIREGKLGDGNTCTISTSTQNLTPRNIFGDYPAYLKLTNLFHRDHIARLDEVIEHHDMCGGDLSKENCKLQRKVQLQAMYNAKPVASAAAEGFSGDVLSAQSPLAKYTEGAVPVDLGAKVHKPIVWCGQVLWDVTNTSITYHDAWKVFQFFMIMESACTKADKNSEQDIAGRVKVQMAYGSHFLRGILPTNLVTFWSECIHAQVAHADQHKEWGCAPKDQ